MNKNNNLIHKIHSIIPILLALFFACSPSPTTDDSRFTPPSETSMEVPFATPSLKFFSFGDWGSGNLQQKNVAQALIHFCNQAPCDFGLLLGDNFYDFGVDSTSDPLWEERFEQMYAGLDLPFYVALGNHDHLGNPQAQIDYTYLPEQTRWKMPSRQFTVSYVQTGTDPLLEIFVLDSHTFSADDAAKLGEDLSASQARWKIVALHHPIYSNGDHGDTPYLIDFLLPIICNKVDVALVGHDHLFTHLDPDDGCGIQHFVVGTGGKSVYGSHPDARVLFTLSEFGFLTLNVTIQQIQVQFHQTDQSIPYEFVLTKP